MIKNKNNYLTSAEVAKKLGFSPDYIRKFLQSGVIKGQKLGRNWIVSEKEISKIKRKRSSRRKNGSITK